MFDHIPNTEERVENTKRSRIFLRKLEVFGNVVKTLSCVFDMSSIETKTKEKTKKTNRKKLR